MEYRDIPTLIHCGSGANRTGIIIAALRVKEGVPVNEAYFEMLHCFHLPTKKVRHFYSLLQEFEKYYHGEKLPLSETADIFV